MNKPEWEKELETRLLALETRIAETYVAKAEGSMETVDIFAGESWKKITTSSEISAQDTAYEVFTRKTLDDLLFVSCECCVGAQNSTDPAKYFYCTLQGVARKASDSGTYQVGGCISASVKGSGNPYAQGNVSINFRVDGSNKLFFKLGSVDVSVGFLSGSPVYTTNTSEAQIRNVRFIFK